MERKWISKAPACILLFLLCLGCSGCGGNSSNNSSTTDPLPATFPLKVGPNGRYLVGQNNQPFLIHGDSPQALIVDLSESDAELFFSNRQAAGFNAVWINLLCAGSTGGQADGSTYDGIQPFTTPGDLSTPNPAYFSRADAMITRAANHGLLVFLDPIETIDWLSVLQSNGEAKARDYGRYLGNRYQAFDNIIWFNGNDFQTWQNPTDDALVQAVALGIKDNDSRHIHTVELNFLVSGSLDDSSWIPIISLNASYTYFPTYAQVLKDYNRSNFLPTFMAESNYEFEKEGTDEQVLRRQEYWSLLSGAAGQLYGNTYTWRFIAGWQSHLDTTGSIQMGYVKSLFGPRAWYNLVPDQGHTFLVNGYGTFSDSGTVAGNDYVTAAITSDGTLAIAYLPTSRTVTLDMSRFSGAVNARWYDPTNGQFSSISGSRLPNNGIQQFAPQALNSEGRDDWVLVMETQ